GMGSPACPSVARVAAFGPKRDASAASAELSRVRDDFLISRMKSDKPRINLSLTLLSITRIARHGIDGGDLLDREVGDDLDAILVHDEHLFDAHAPLMHLAVLRLQREDHAFLDL